MTISPISRATERRRRVPTTTGLDPHTEQPPRVTLGWVTLAVVTALYLACIVLTTYPFVLHAGSSLPSPPSDPLMHLWEMRWYKSCLLEGKLPFFCPDVQYPVGAPLGNFSPMLLQSIFYAVFSCFIQNDILIYNIIWFSGFLVTGLGTFSLAWYTSRDRACAAFAGMLGMLSAPVMFHSCGHLELIFAGLLPLFLAAWMSFVDRPGRGRLLSALSCYILVGLSAAYFAVIAVFPAVLYVIWQACRAGRSGFRDWLREKAAWLFLFAALSGPALLVLFSNQLWAVGHGYSLTRPRWEFNMYGAPLWGYFLPTIAHRAGRWFLPFNPYEAAGIANTTGECASYLGVVTLGLLYYAAVQRVRRPRMRFLWATLLFAIILSLGAQWTIGTHRIPLPASWLWKTLFVFRSIRVPARFNMLACLLAAVLAAAGLQHLLARLPGRRSRAALFAALTVVAFFDISTLTFGPHAVPAMPACYAVLKQRDPRATFLEIPQISSGGTDLNATCGYWQALHQCRTTGGYSSHMNAAFDNLLTYNSPFSARDLAKPDYLLDPDALSVDLVSHVRFKDYAWLYMKAHGLRFLIMHHWKGSMPETPVRLDRLKALLEEAKVYEDEATTVFEQAKLPLPSRPTLLCTEGWNKRLAWQNRYTCVVGKAGRLAVYNPDPERDLTLTLEASAFRRKRSVRVLAGDRELARWQVEPDVLREYTSPTFRLPAGLQRLTIESDGEDRPKGHREAPAEGDMRPFSLRASGVSLRAANPTPPPSVAASP